MEESAQDSAVQFVAINYITCSSEYAARFEHLFRTRAHAIDRVPGFCGMKVLKPSKGAEPYLIVSHWTSEEAFKNWLDSPEFLEGHIRGFEDLKEAKLKGEKPPMTSKFVTYSVLTD